MELNRVQSVEWFITNGIEEIPEFLDDTLKGLEVH